MPELSIRERITGRRRRPAPGTELERTDGNALSFNEWLSFFSFQGLQYPIVQTSLGNDPHEELGTDHRALAEGAYKRNGIVFATAMTRQLVFQEARFQFRTLQSGRPGEYFGSPALRRLEVPWPNGTTGDLNARAEQDVTLAGNFYAVAMDDRTQPGPELRRLNPAWVSILMSSRRAPDNPRNASDLRIEAYGYKPPDEELEVFPASEVVHYAPVPDPSTNFRGMSWLNPVVDEIMGDSAASRHKLKFFEQGGTPNFIVRFDPAIDKDAVDAWIAAMEDQIGGVENAYRTLYLGGGADAKVIGSNLKDVDFKQVQGAGETRIAAAAGVPPIIVGLSEGLESATYSNYSQARRRFADATLRPLWRNFAGSLATVIAVPRRAELWYDDRDIPFLAEDQKDAAEILATNAQAVKALVEAGFAPDSAVEAVDAGDLRRLAHTGMFSVQLHPPGTMIAPAGAGPVPPPLADNADNPPALPAAGATGNGNQPGRFVARSDALPAELGGTDKTPHGEAGLRASIRAFEQAERDVVALLRLAVDGDADARARDAVAVLDDLRAEPVAEHLTDAYSEAFEGALAHLDDHDARAEINPDVEALAVSLRGKLHEAIDTAELGARRAFRDVTEDNVEEQAKTATTAFTDAGGRNWPLGAFAANQISTVGRRASSRGVRDAAGGGMVQISEHGSTHPVCSQLEGQTFPAFAAPEPPFHEGCEHFLIPVQ